MIHIILVYLSQIDFLCKIIPRQIKAENAVKIIRDTVEELIVKCKEIVESENEQIEGEEYVNEGDPSILRFLLASRDEVINLSIFFTSFTFNVHNFNLCEATHSS
jgi:carotene epsilon-monooxygenase